VNRVVALSSCLSAVVALVLATPAWAGIEDSIGLGPRASALGGSYAARPGDFAATYYNPAGLVRGDDQPGFADLSLGFVFARPIVDVTRFDGSAIATPTELPDTLGFLLGIRFDLGRVFDYEGLNAGVSLYLPTDFFAWSVHPDERVQWLFLTDRREHLSASAGIGWAPLPWLSLGVGARLLFDSETLTFGRVTSIEAETDPDTGETSFEVATRLGEDVTVGTRFTPTAGLLFTPIERLRVGVSYRGETFVDDTGSTSITGVPGLGELGYSHHFNHYFQPHEITVAVSWDATSEGSGWSLSSDLTWSDWSSGYTTNRNTYETGLFGDTWTPSVGFSKRLVRGVDAMAGYRFQRAPFGNFGGPSNLLVNDRHLSSLGMTIGIGELLGADLDIGVSWAFQLAWLVEREERKDFRRFESDADLAENPGASGYRYGGVVPAGSLAVEVAW